MLAKKLRVKRLKKDISSLLKMIALLGTVLVAKAKRPAHKMPVPRALSAGIALLGNFWVPRFAYSPVPLA